MEQSAQTPIILFRAGFKCILFWRNFTFTSDRISNALKYGPCLKFWLRISTSPESTLIWSNGFCFRVQGDYGWQTRGSSIYPAIALRSLSASSQMSRFYFGMLSRFYSTWYDFKKESYFIIIFYKFNSLKNAIKIKNQESLDDPWFHKSCFFLYQRFRRLVFRRSKRKHASYLRLNLYQETVGLVISSSAWQEP